MFSRAPRDANVGLATGRESGVVVLDNDEVGCGGSIRWLQERHGHLPETRTHCTPSGNTHELYGYPAHLEHLPSRRISWAYELKADGVGVVLPPSVTDRGAYEVLYEREIVPLPQCLVDFATDDLTVIEGGAALRDKSAPRGWFALPDRIREGERWDTLWRYGCSLRAHGWGHRAILEELRRVSREVCVQPPDASHSFTDTEARKAARYAMTYEPGDDSPVVSPEVLRAVAFLEEKAKSRPKKGKAAYSRWASYRALLDTARRHGYMHGGEVAVNISVRQLALAAGLSVPTLRKAIEESPLMYRLSFGEGAKAGDLALRVPPRRAPTFHTRTTPRVAIERGVSPAERPGEQEALYALRHGYAVGKAKGALLEQVLEAGEISRRELAKRLGKQPDALKQPLRELVGLGLLERVKRGMYRAVGNWKRILERERVMSGEARSAHLDVAAYERQREGFRRHLVEKANERRER